MQQISRDNQLHVTFLSIEKIPSNVNNLQEFMKSSILELIIDKSIKGREIKTSKNALEDNQENRIKLN